MPRKYNKKKHTISVTVFSLQNGNEIFTKSESINAKPLCHLYTTVASGNIRVVGQTKAYPIQLLFLAVFKQSCRGRSFFILTRPAWRNQRKVTTFNLQNRKTSRKKGNVWLAPNGAK